MQSIHKSLLLVILLSIVSYGALTIGMMTWGGSASFNKLIQSLLLLISLVILFVYVRYIIKFGKEGIQLYKVSFSALTVVTLPAVFIIIYSIGWLTGIF